MDRERDDRVVEAAVRGTAALGAGRPVPLDRRTAVTSMTEWTGLAPAPPALDGDERYHVFLSYRSVNRTWVLNLYDVLRQHGLSVFLDQVVLKVGDPLIDGLEDGLRQSRAGVLVWSTSAADSKWVQREYRSMEMRADDERFRFVPVKLDRAPLPDFAAQRLFSDFSSYPDGPNGGELLRLLYSIVGAPLTDEAARFANEHDRESQHALNGVAAATRNGRADRLVELYTSGGLPWLTSSALACRAAEGLIRLGHPREAVDMMTETEQRFPVAIRPQQLRALALARRGDPGDLEAAQDVLGELYAAGERDPETLGIYARTWMDRFEGSGNRAFLGQSRRLYAEAFASAQDDSYTGINAAAKSVLLDDLDKAAEYAERVQAIVGVDVVTDDYWQTATAAEAQLIQRRFAEAARLYVEAVAGAPAEVGSHASTWAQAKRLLDHLEPSGDERAAIRDAFAHLATREATPTT